MTLRAADGRATTSLVCAGRPIAVLGHRVDLLDDPALVEEVGSAARLALDHERLQAVRRAQLEALRASRARIVETGDVERRRLERDLHDGAQQRLVALTLTLRLARIRLEPQFQPEPTLIARIERADEELHATLAELRKLATGIFPAVLADEGLAPAVDALAEETPGQMRITNLPEQRFDAAIETAAYRVISETVKQAGTSPVKLNAFTGDGLLVLELESRRLPTELLELEDRLGALDGTLELAHAPGGQARIRAEIPCAS